MFLELPWDQWPCVCGLSVVTSLDRNFCVRLTRWRFSSPGTNPSRETIFEGANGDRGFFFFPVQLTQAGLKINLLNVMTNQHAILITY